jgi:hypothetical protein
MPNVETEVRTARGRQQQHDSQNDVLIEIDPAPAGEHAKKRQLEYDGRDAGL